jgi:hypothetical protein
MFKTHIDAESYGPGELILKNILTWLSENKPYMQINPCPNSYYKEIPLRLPVAGWLKLARLRKFRPKFDLENVGLI